MSEKKKDERKEIIQLVPQEEIIAYGEKVHGITKEEADAEEAKLQEKLDNFFLENGGINYTPKEIEEDEEELIDLIVDEDGNMQIIGEAKEKEEVAVAIPSFIDDTILRYAIKKRLDKYKKTLAETAKLTFDIEYIKPGLYDELDKSLTTERNKLQSILFLDTISLDTLDENLQKKIISEAKDLVVSMLDLVSELKEQEVTIWHYTTDLN